MRRFVSLWEELESRPEDGDRVAALVRWLQAAGPEAGIVASAWLLPPAGGRPAGRPARIALTALADAARELAGAAGTPAWLFETGRAAADEAAEAIALLLPWPAPGTPGTRPSLAGWLAAWQAAAQEPDAGRRLHAIAASIAGLDDAPTRRWAVRAACGLVRALVDEGQWLRAWSGAFGEDAHALAWRWHAQGRLAAMAGAGIDASPVPRPQAFGEAAEADEPAHAGLLEAVQAGEFWLEPRWSGARVQVVRRGGAVAVWTRDGALLNARLPEALIEALAWPEPCTIEGVLVGWRAGRIVSPWLAAEPPKRTRARSAEPPAATMHLVLTDWHRWGEDAAEAWDPHARRERLQGRWPAAGAEGPQAPPPVFTTPVLDPPEAAGGDASALARLAAHGRGEGGAGWSGLVLRRRAAHGPRPHEADWAIAATSHRVRAALQYVPREALGAGAAAVAALAFAPCGFALWSRPPRSAAELGEAMSAAMRGEAAADGRGTDDDDALRLLPLARLPLALPDEDLRAIHAWLRANAGSRFGNVHAVAPALVFEIGFGALHASRRHKIGATISEARLLRWLAGAAPDEVQCVADLRAAGDRGLASA
jgi:DNA ligase-1